MEFADHMDNIFDELSDLSELQRHTLKQRYRFLMSEYRRRCLIYASLFYMFRITVTVGSLAVPALLSIQNGNTSSPYLYWLTWGISLAVTTSNGIMTLFKVDKRFFMLHATAERLRSETWQFIQLSGRYSGHHGTPHHEKATHANQFVYYCSQLEKINMKRVDDEYIKTTDEAHLPVAQRPITDSQKPSGDTMVPSPADQSNLKSPDPSDRDSISLIGDDDDDDSQSKSKNAKANKTLKNQPKQNQKQQPIAVTIAMPVPDTHTTTLSPQSTDRQTVLSPSSTV